MAGKDLVRETSPAGFLAGCRAQARSSQRHLAYLAGRWQSSISDIERGEINPTVGTLAHLLDAMGLELVLVARRKEGT